RADRVQRGRAAAAAAHHQVRRLANSGEEERMSPTDLALVPGGLGAGDLVYRTPPETRMVRAEGVRLWDSTGRPYLDAEAANGAVSFGYDGTLVAEGARRCTALPGLPSFCESEPRVSVLQRLNHRFEAALGRPGRVSVELGGAQGIEMA